VLAIAREHDVDLSKVPGTGHEGRVTRQDVLAYISGQDNASAKPIMSVPLPDDAILFISPTRRTIAEHMVESARNIPHAWFSVEADLTNLVALRGDVKDDFRLHKGVDLTYLPFAVKAAIDALGKHPIVNSSWVDEGILQKKEVRIGIAMATDRGLVVPVIPDAARLSITQLARTISDLVERARARRLKPEDVEGGTFTINNTGAFGSVMSMPIINYPQAAILTLEAIVPRPVVHENAIVIRQMANLCLSFDHRVLDGSQAGAFLATVKANLESFGPGTKLDP
jgi:2-oxoisovalerate dehydrogenase E2 component (dihydrolipoyl transacylase)